ncbi:MAG: hypothetical protein AAGB32_04590 [Pseudomonadota bacterium]
MEEAAKRMIVCGKHAVKEHVATDTIGLIVNCVGIANSTELNSALEKYDFVPFVARNPNPEERENHFEHAIAFLEREHKKNYSFIVI